MKNSKKTWGMLGTSMGSVLIIVALLTMVGMGSNDTYASQGFCECSGTRKGDKCIVSVVESRKTVCGDSACQARTGVPVGPHDTGCAGPDPAGLYTCTTYTDQEVPCKCGDGYTTSSSGACIPTGGDDKPTGPVNSCTNLSIGADCTTSDGKTGKCIDSGSSTGGRVCKATTTGDDDKPSSTPGAKCDSGTYYDGNYGCLPCTEGFYCPGGTFSHSTADINGSGRKKCPETATSCTSTEFTCSGEYEKNTAGTDCVKKTGGDDKPNNPNKPTGGDDKPSNPNKPNNPNKPSGGGDDGSGGNGGGNNGGGNSGGNTGGNGNGGNAGGNNGNNNGGNNTTKNPNTATKAPLVIAIIGIISVGISSVVYFKGKKEINTEI